MALSVGVCGLLAISWFCLAYDLAFGTLSAWVEMGDHESLYQQPRSGAVFDQWVGVVDVFDWHRVSGQARTIRFEELYTFCIALLGLVSLSASLVWWVYVALELMRGGQGSTATTVGVGLRLADHLLLNLT